LIGANKKDIMEMAKQIGTYEISTRPYEDCCSLFVAKHPQTKAKLENVLKLEKNLSLPDLDKIAFKSYYISNI
jgi:thiamine biosynthesis protein ThiI